MAFIATSAFPLQTREKETRRERERERKLREKSSLQRREIRTLGEIDVVCFFMCNGKRRGRKLTRSLVYSIFDCFSSSRRRRRRRMMDRTQTLLVAILVLGLGFPKKKRL